jgi:hypothetical protein
VAQYERQIADLEQLIGKFSYLTLNKYWKTKHTSTHCGLFHSFAMFPENCTSKV